MGPRTEHVSIFQKKICQESNLKIMDSIYETKKIYGSGYILSIVSFQSERVFPALDLDII